MGAHDHDPMGVADPHALDTALARLIDDAPVPLIVQRGGAVVYASTAARAAFGASIREGHELFSADHVHEDDRSILADAQAHAASGSIWRGTIRLEYGPNDHRPTQVSIFGVDFGGSAIAYFARELSLDVEDRAHLFVNSRSASAAVLAGGVAHEINNPLATIMTNLGFVSDQLRLVIDDLPVAPPSVCDRLRQSIDALTDTHASATRIESIVRDLKAFVPDGQAKTSVDVNEAVRVALRRIEVDAHPAVRIDVQLGAPPPVDANAARLAQAFYNVIVNAIEAIPDDGRTDHVVRVVTAASNDDAVVSVSDTGDGIAANVRPRIFDAFFTTKPQGDGMGLGLFVVHAVVTSLGGRIEIETLAKSTALPPAARTGTTVVLRMPGVPEPPRSREIAK